MANTIYNIKQLTNFDIQDKQKYPIIGQHKILNVESSKSIDYVHITFNKNVSKLGYCCESRLIGYPIILYFEDGSYKPFKIDKTGIFEVQPEVFKSQDENNKVENLSIEVNIIGIDVPRDFGFNLDYAYAV